MHHVLATTFLLHPLGVCTGTQAQITNCRGLNFWSGIGSDLGEYTIALAALSGLAAWWHKHNCHHQRCLRLAWHPHPDHGHPICKHHHPHRIITNALGHSVIAPRTPSTPPSRPPDQTRPSSPRTAPGRHSS